MCCVRPDAGRVFTSFTYMYKLHIYLSLLAVYRHGWMSRRAAEATYMLE